MNTRMNILREREIKRESGSQKERGSGGFGRGGETGRETGWGERRTGGREGRREGSRK